MHTAEPRGAGLQGPSSPGGASSGCSLLVPSVLSLGRGAATAWALPVQVTAPLSSSVSQHYQHHWSAGFFQAPCSGGAGHLLEMPFCPWSSSSRKMQIALSIPGPLGVRQGRKTSPVRDGKLIIKCACASERLLCKQCDILLWLLGCLWHGVRQELCVMTPWLQCCTSAPIACTSASVCVCLSNSCTKVPGHIDKTEICFLFLGFSICC